MVIYKKGQMKPPALRSICAITAYYDFKKIEILFSCYFQAVSITLLNIQVHMNVATLLGAGHCARSCCPSKSVLDFAID